MKEETYRTLLDGSFSIDFNANDYFYWATAMSVPVSASDYLWIMFTIEKFPIRGLDACLAYIQNQEPIKPWINNNFNEVIKYLIDKKQIVYGDSDYGHNYNWEEEIYRKVDYNERSNIK